MKFLMLIKIANSDYESGKLAPAELQDAMGKLMGEWTQAGAMVSAAGLRPTSHGARVRLTGSKVVVIDGPFTEAKEVIGGFFVLESPSKADAVAKAQRVAEIHREVLGKDFVLECEVREFQG